MDFFVTCTNYILLTKAAKNYFPTSSRSVSWFWLFCFIYHQYLEKGDNLKHFQQIIAHISRQQVVVTMSAILLLMLVNWLLESFKMALTLPVSWRNIGMGCDRGGFLRVDLGHFYPQPFGEYAGRVLFLPNRKRIHGVFAMAVGSFGQNVITNVLGLSAGLWFLASFFLFK